MRNDVLKAVHEVKKMYGEFQPSTAWETPNYIVLIDENDGIPPAIISKSDYSTRFAVLGNKTDMDIAYKDSIFIEEIKQ